MFADYLLIIIASKSNKWYKETERLIGQFREFIGEFPPTLELFTSFFQRYNKPEIRSSTRARYYYVFSAFFKWYDGSSLPFKIKSPKPVPQLVTDEEVAKLKSMISSRKTHKGLIERDILIIDLLYHTGLRLSEMTNLRVRDLRLTGNTPYLKVLQGKGSKDRDVNLNSYICKRLKSYTTDKMPDDKVIGIASKTVNSLFTNWAKKAGVPQIHPHSLRHKFATDIINRGGSLRDVQQLMGHESLATTEAYLAVTKESLTKIVELLDVNSSRDNQMHDENKVTIVERVRHNNTEYKAKIKQAAIRMAENIIVPSFWDKKLWQDLPLDFGQGKYNIPIGMLTIDKNRMISIEYKNQIEDLVRPHILEALLKELGAACTHFSQLVGKEGALAIWKQDVEDYFELGMELLKTISDDIRSLDVTVNYDNKLTVGFTRWCPLTIWKDVVQVN